jgi:hypothetical protein
MPKCAGNDKPCPAGDPKDQQRFDSPQQKTLRKKKRFQNVLLGIAPTDHCVGQLKFNDPSIRSQTKSKDISEAQIMQRNGQISRNIIYGVLSDKSSYRCYFN